MAGDFDLSDGDWENSAIDDFDRRRSEICRICGDEHDGGDDRLCDACRAQPARMGRAAT
jgi:hypothetical protein